MSNILSYPLIPVVSGEDLLIISDTSVKGNPTRSVRVDQIIGGGSGSGVLMVDASINGNAVSVTGGPITISGVLDFRFGGLSTQYVNGLGNLVTFPTISNPYVLPLAANGTRGGVQIGYAEAGQNYPVELSNEKMFVNVPWTNTNTNTTYDLTSIQNVNDVYVHLTGSDATVDTIQLVAGTNITLTDDGLNNITIDATSSGGTGTVTRVGALNGTFISSASADITIAGDLTYDLSAVNGTDTSGLFLSKDNVWSTIPGGNVGTITEIIASHAGTAFVATVTNATGPVTSIAISTSGGTAADYINGAGNYIPLSTLPSGSVTSVASGPGITATPSPITGAGSIEVDYLGLDNVILSGGALITDAVSSDYILLSEAKNNNCAHSLISDLPGYYTNFFAAADTGSANSIGQAETLTLTGGDSINTATSSPGITTISLAYKSVVLRLLPPIGVGLPTITVVQNDLGSTLALTSTSVGEYVLSTSGGTGNFGTNVIAFIENPNEYGANPPIYPQATTIRWKANTEIAIRSFDVATGTRANIAGIWNVCVEIRVYP